MTEHALPIPPDVFGVNGVVIGRTVGLVAALAGTILTRTALKALGDQYNVIGVRAVFFVDYRALASGLHCFWAVGKGETQGRRRRAVCIRPPPHLHVSFSFAVC